ncbi:urease accessory protein UreF [Actinomyces gaoshouyii]|uniref:Urease accessory protein UreF n=1 Tax=Actinomyces gaoshouyii TaxID=1960083 RepID=A0A8H9LFP8_9ACTO|nr:urease accessory protein UreF [Actinomyces gaoshouyii]GGO96740.1 urease accessory protein UreF [Actinomyces gaoshouyii]
MPSTLTDPAAGTAPEGAVPGWLLPLAQLCDSALPTGAFSHSLGMETYISEGIIHDEESFVAWLRVLIATQLTYSDALGLRLAHEAALDGSTARLRQIDLLLRAQAIPRQVREAGRTMGRRMLAIALASVPQARGALEGYSMDVISGACSGHPAVVLALVGHALNAPIGALMASYLQSSVISLTQNAVRAVPLGQDAGQRSIATVRDQVREAVRTALSLEADELGATAPGIEIAQMRHEHQRARMFMS